MSERPIPGFYAIVALTSKQFLHLKNKNIIAKLVPFQMTA
jgi:hypothetical protein